MLPEHELAELEATLLPALERHHLRLLAHSLRTLQTIAARREGRLPEPAEVAAWVRAQPQLAGDSCFLERFVQELLRAGDQLVTIAAARGMEGDPLALQLRDLTVWAQEQADHRLAQEVVSGNRAAAPPPQD